MLAAITRSKLKQFMGDYQFGVLAVGGGITVAGSALDAVTRGISAALVEMQNFAVDTPRRSTKLAQGGLRYLKQFEVGNVVVTGKECDSVYRNSPIISETKVKDGELSEGSDY